MSKVKLLICYHKPATLFQDEILTPIHVGRANAKKKFKSDDPNFKWLMDNMIGDDTGDNISDRNGWYNEMTSLYWAWKNYDKIGNPDYIGLMHYRRHFVFREDERIVYNIENFNEKTYLQEINYSPETVYKMLEGCDFITHIGKVLNVYNHYIENHRKEDLDLAVDIMLEKYPEYKEITKEYFAGDYSNFCNMFIFNKKLFFEYCAWIFDILQECENRMDVSEKRFFISERLTGIFIAKLMKDKTLKYKVLPISFIEDPVKIPIAISLNSRNTFQVAVAITSMLEAAKGYNQYNFYLLHNEDISEKTKRNFRAFSDKYKFCKIEFKKMDIHEDYYPLFLSESLNKENKCIYLSGDIIAMQDLGEFYRTCSTDDFYAVGTPLNNYDASEKNKELSQYILVLNCGRLRKHKMWETVKNDVEAKKNGIDLFNNFCKGQIGYIPWYFVTRESEYDYKEYVIKGTQSRGEIQIQTTWRAFMVYDYLEPWINNQGVYSIFWWNNAVKVPPIFRFVLPKSKELNVLYSRQQREINELHNNEPNNLDKNPSGIDGREINELHNNEPNNLDKNPSGIDGNEEWRNYSLLGKLRFYYQHNGLKKTILYSCKKIVKR